jgi:hypothetical protein
MPDADAHGRCTNDRVRRPHIHAFQDARWRYRQGAKQDDAGLSIRSASVVERLPHGFGPMLRPLDIDSVLRAQAIDVTTRGEMLLMRSKGYIKS